MPAAAIRDATPDDLPALRALFRRANDAPYDLERVAEEKCFGDGIAGAPVARMYDDVGVAVTCGKWLRILAVDRDARRRGIGSALLADAESRGAHVVFAEPGNYFTPGVLASDEGTLAFFRAHGYRETSETWNLETHIRNPVIPSVVEGPGWAGGAIRVPPTHPGPSTTLGMTKLEPRTSNFNRELASFIERHFGAIWRFESSRAHAIYTTEENGAITGFAAIEANNRGLGTFGPTGVAKSHRGKGLGTALLDAALAGLHDLGYTRVTIPWTDALDFYRKACGAEAEYRFLAMTKHSDETHA
ncbi:MAG TPA: GNAT family N-acetyltransferase [Thermoanaerobaculia bacterium]|nr:GNAT family N-acetyltransferase [Thermoanaerobaculia bacterium]